MITMVSTNSLVVPKICLKSTNFRIQNMVVKIMTKTYWFLTFWENPDDPTFPPFIWQFLARSHFQPLIVLAGSWKRHFHFCWKEKMSQVMSWMCHISRVMLKMISMLYRKKIYGDGQTIAPPVGPWCHCRTKQMLILFWEAASHADVIAQSWLVRSSLSFDPLPTLLPMDSFCCSRGAGSDTSLNPASFGTTHNFLCPLSLACCLVFVCTQHCMD